MLLNLLKIIFISFCGRPDNLTKRDEFPNRYPCLLSWMKILEGDRSVPYTLLINALFLKCHDPSGLPIQPVPPLGSAYPDFASSRDSRSLFFLAFDIFWHIPCILDRLSRIFFKDPESISAINEDENGFGLGGFIRRWKASKIFNGKYSGYES